jgi:LysM domain-containing protein
MVTMAARRPRVTMNHGPAAAGARPVRTPVTLPHPRLTRHGRMAVTGVSALLIGALSAGLATAAQATRSGPASPGRHLSKVAVTPGQSLWSMAEAYDPDADTRQVVQQIKQLNSMAGDQVRAGEVLWVPRG